MHSNVTTAISIPGRALGQMELRSSVSSVPEIINQISDLALRSAIELLHVAALNADSDIAFVARPEMYTTAVARTWLNEKLPNLKSHIAISDGISAGLIEGVSNIICPFSQCYRSDALALDQLQSRCPELLQQFSASINCRIKGIPVRVQRNEIEYQSNNKSLVQRTVTWNYFDYHFGTPNQVVQPHKTVQREFDSTIDNLKEFDVILTSDNALYSNEFVSLVCHEISKAYANPNRGLIIQLPYRRSAESSAWSETDSSLYARVRAATIFLPPSIARNIIMIDAPMTPNMPENTVTGKLFAAYDFPFWNYNPLYYSRVSSFLVWSPPRAADETFFDFDLISEITGTPPVSWVRH